MRMNRKDEITLKTFDGQRFTQKNHVVCMIIKATSFYILACVWISHAKHDD